MTIPLFNMKTLPIICGFNKASEAGVDIFAPSIFLAKCNFRCPYCMNSKLVTGEIQSKVDIETIRKFVQEEKSEWLMISGGEPTCTSTTELTNLLEEIKSWGCKIGMSTNGSNIYTLSCVMKYLSYIALDIKASNKDDYEMLSGFESAFDRVLTSVKIIRENKESINNFDFELRTTLYPSVVTEAVLSEIGSNIVKKYDKWVLQQFRHSKNMLDENCTDVEPYSDGQLKELLEIAKQFCDNVSIRYV